MTRVFRIQAKDGRGPFRPGFSHTWADEFFSDGMEELPTWIEEFGRDLIDRKGLPGDHYGSATRTIDGLCRWFSSTERQHLATLGFNMVSLKINRILAESKNQLVFARALPLSHGAVVVPWPQLELIRQQS